MQVTGVSVLRMATNACMNIIATLSKFLLLPMRMNIFWRTPVCPLIQNLHDPTVTNHVCVLHSCGNCFSPYVHQSCTCNVAPAFPPSPSPPPINSPSIWSCGIFESDPSRFYPRECVSPEQLDALVGTTCIKARTEIFANFPGLEVVCQKESDPLPSNSSLRRFLVLTDDTTGLVTGVYQDRP